MYIQMMTPPLNQKSKICFNGEGITHVITLTHANVAERFIRTLKNQIYDRVRFTSAPWTEMLEPVIKKV